MSGTPTQTLISALALPASCQVDQRIPKKLLLENGAPTCADRRLINDAVEEIQWLAALKPNTVGVAEYRDDQREYIEVAVLCIITRHAPQGAGAGLTNKFVNIARLAELVHRAVPYPVLLLLSAPHCLLFSLAHKRWAHNDTGKVVLDGEASTADVALDLTAEHPFLQALALTRQPQASLLALYQGWMDCLINWQVAQYTGTFTATGTPAQAAVRREALSTCRRLELQSSRLRALAAKEKQMAKQVDLNLALKRIGADLILAREQLLRPV